MSGVEGVGDHEKENFRGAVGWTQNGVLCGTTNRDLALSMNVPGTSGAVQQIRGKRRRGEVEIAGRRVLFAGGGVRQIYVRVIVKRFRAQCS